MSLFSNDTFTGTAGTLLENHTGEAGATWTKQWTGGAAMSNANRLRSSDASVVYTASGTPASADYDATATLKVLSLIEANMDAGIVVRHVATSSPGTFYLARFLAGGTNKWQIYKSTTQGFTLLGEVAGTLNVGGAPVVTLKVRGTTTTTLTLVVDGATTLTASDSTSPLTTAGKAGVWFGVAQTDTTGIHVDSFSASNPSTTPTQKQIIFDGNSLTAGQDSTTGNDYPSQVLALLGSGWTGQNFGVSGQTTTQMSSDAATQIDPLYSTATYLDNWLAAWEVTNDLYFGASATTAYNNYVSYCQARRAAGWKVIAVTVLPRSNSGTPSSFETDRQTCNTNIRANWSTFADVIADVAADARIGDAGDETNPTYYYISGTADTRVHLVDAGYAIIARHVANAVLGKAAAYTLTGASTGAVGQAVTLTLALSPSGRTQSPAAAITLTDNAGGTFSPAAPQLSTASQSVSVSYTPASTGTKTIVGTNTQNLADAQPFSFQAVALGDKKISELPDLTSLSASDYLPIVSGGATKRVTLATLAAWVKTN